MDVATRGCRLHRLTHSGAAARPGEAITPLLHRVALAYRTVRSTSHTLQNTAYQVRYTR